MKVLTEERYTSDKSPQSFIWILNKREVRLLEEMAQIAVNENKRKTSYKTMLEKIGMTPVF